MMAGDWAVGVWVGLGCLVGATAGWGASFDCGQARSGTERMICSEAGLGARDEIMAAVYAAALQKDGEGRVRDGQREWLAKAGACGSVACLAAAYDGRIGVLLRTEGGNAAAAHFFSEAPKGNHATLDVVGPVHGFAAVSLTATFVGAGGADAGDVNVGSFGAVIELRQGAGEGLQGRCAVGFRALGSASWKVEQRGNCDLPQGAAFSGIYQR